jgi:alkaline phosphatase
MTITSLTQNRRLLAGAVALAATAALQAAPTVSRLTPPSMLFSFNDPGTPITARFLPGQRFDLQATVSPDAGQTITGISFKVDGTSVTNSVAFTTTGLTAKLADGVTLTPAGTTIGTARAYANSSVGVHTLTVIAQQSNGGSVTNNGNFEVVGISQVGRRAKNVIILLGDGMGVAHRTAARLMKNGAQQGKANAPLAMDLFPVTGIVTTHSLNSIVTDSAPGMACYSTGNKSFNGQEGVFPDDTTAPFDNPRVEYMGEYLARTQGKSLGIVTTADVFDATPGAMAVHTGDRGAGTGICDQYLDEAATKANLKVLLGGGRKWFLPKGTTGSVRANASDYVLPADLAAGWGVAAGSLNETRDLLSDFGTAGFTYAPDRTTLNNVPANTDKLLGLFSFSNMNVAKDKIDGRRNAVPAGSATGQTVVTDYGFPDQPMLDEMTDKALTVLNRNPNGFVLMIEGASIDKQAHQMDSERWIEDAIEFDYAVEKVRQFVLANPDTLAIITADHECGGISINGASTVTDASLQAKIAAGNGSPTNYTTLRDTVVGNYDAASFPVYTLGADGYPTTTDVDFRMLIGYAGGVDGYQDWRTNPFPIHDTQQPLDKTSTLTNYPRVNITDSGAVNTNRPIRDVAGSFQITGYNPGNQAVHTASDIPLSAAGRGAAAFTGVQDNTEVFFKAMQAVLGGAK